MSFTIGDPETSAANLTVTASSSNPSLISPQNIVLGGGESNRTVTVTSEPAQYGSATITLAVSDGSMNAEQRFVLTVVPMGIGTFSFTNRLGILIPDAGPAVPYASVINISGLEGTIAKVQMNIKGLAHTWPDDIDMLLVSPSGDKIRVMSDVGGRTAVSDINLTLTDSAATFLPDHSPLSSGPFKPTNVGRDMFPAPAPSSPYGAEFSAFKGSSANGAWTLYVVDDGRGDRGKIEEWSLTVTTILSANASPGAAVNDVESDSGSDLVGVRVQRLDESGCVVLEVKGLPSQKYLIETSDDLNTWSSLGTATGDTDLAPFSDCDAVNHAQRFYRVSESLP